MQHTARVRMRDRAPNASDRSGDNAKFSTPAARPIRDRFPAGHEAHREIVLRLVLPDFVNRHDIRMMQIRRGVRFVLKQPQRRFPRQFAGQNHLHRHFALQADLPCAINHSHSAARDLLAQFVIAKAADLRRV